MIPLKSLIEAVQALKTVMDADLNERRLSGSEYREVLTAYSNLKAHVEVISSRIPVETKDEPN